MTANPLPLEPGMSPARKRAAAVFLVVALAAVAALAMYLSGVIFLLLNWKSPGQAGLTSIVDFWALNSDDPVQRRRLKLSIAIASGGISMLLIGAFLSAARPRRSLYGDARFATRAEVERANLIGSSDLPRIMVGKLGDRCLGLAGQQSVLICAPTRSGKGSGVVIPNLLSWPHSVVVLDIKGENFALTAGHRVFMGQAVWAFSPFNEPAGCHRWNPLAAVRPTSRHRIGDLLRIGQVLYPNDGTGSTSEAFFNDQARNLFMGLGLLLLETPELPLTIGEMLRQCSGKGLPLDSHIGRLFSARQKAGQPYSSQCREALQRTLSNSPNTLSSIVATALAPLTIFADPVVDAATSASDFQLDQLRRQPMSVYVRIPPDRLADARPLLALFYSQLINLNTKQLPEEDPSLRLQCLLVNDEFAALGRISAISNSAAYLAGYNLRLLTVLQAVSQLDAAYGEKEARTFATNHALQILFAPREQRDAIEYSAMLGDFTERATSRGRSTSHGLYGHSSTSRTDSDHRRPLLLPQEFRELGTEQLVVIMENCKPILGEKLRYYRDKAFKPRLKGPPAVPDLAVETYQSVVESRWQRVKAALPAGSARHISPYDEDGDEQGDSAGDDDGGGREAARRKVVQTTLIGLCGNDGLGHMPPLAPEAAPPDPQRSTAPMRRHARD